MNHVPLLVLAISLPLLLGGCGGVLKVPLNKLSKADQKFLKAKSFPKESTKGEAYINPNLKYKIRGYVVVISACDEKASGALTIPAMIEGKAVTRIEEKAFLNCSSLTSITIPDSVTSIGSSAFSQCSNLTSITIPDSVTSIGRYDTFERCTSLTSITIPQSVTSIGAFAFYGCTNLTSITIPDSVTSIGAYAFRFCLRLTSITIGDSVTSIGHSTFSKCSSLTAVTFLGNAPKAGGELFKGATPTIYCKPETKGWGDTWGGKPVKLISEKP